MRVRGCLMEPVSRAQAPSNPSSHEFREKAQAVATLPTELLVGALNEHVGGREHAGLAAAGQRLLHAWARLMSAWV